MKTKIFGSALLAIGLVLIFMGLTYKPNSASPITNSAPLPLDSISQTIKSSVVPTSVVPASVVPASVVPASVVPASVVPASVVPTSVVPTSVVPTSQQICPTTLKEGELKGCLFEEWVKQKFDVRIFSSETWNKSGSLDNNLTGSGIPDFYYKIETETKKEYFHVECVYRSSTSNGEVSWGSDEKVSDLNAYALHTKDPVFLILGIGGQPNSPNEVRIIKITGNTPGKYLLADMPKARRIPDADFKFDPITKQLF